MNGFTDAKLWPDDSQEWVTTAEPRLWINDRVWAEITGRAA